MIAPAQLYDFLKQQGISFYTGVPDSLLKYFLKYIQDHSAANEHIITANEGLSIGLAAGYHFSTGKLPLVYLQNSGLGNTINPLTSLADKEVYAVPMLLLIGWRGMPGIKDEPQHVKMGRITRAMLEVLEIPCYVLEADEHSSFTTIAAAIEEATSQQKPVALLAPPDLFEKYEGSKEHDAYSLVRKEVIGSIIDALKGDEIVVCTTGKIGREFYEQNRALNKKVANYFLSVGAMGHANHIALGMRMHSDKKLVMLDGDGAVLMQMGGLTSLANHARDNFVHIVINNGSHESVGGQPTEAFAADLCAVARGCGYELATCIRNEQELGQWLKEGLASSAVQFAEIRTGKTSVAEPGRPAGQPVEWKKELAKAFLKDK